MFMMSNHMHCIIENVLNVYDALQNDNSNESFQRDAHDTTQNENVLIQMLRGRPVEKPIFYQW